MSDNADQIAYWNDDAGRRWTDSQEALDRLLQPMADLALAAARAAAGERVLDVGCGCGATTLLLAEKVGAAGAVVGVDVSTPMLARARSRAEGVAAITFIEADASSAALPAPFDLVFSRFGVMFFADPAPAFAHIRSSLRRDGRLAFVCWRAFAQNDWAFVPTMATLEALGVTPPPTDPHAPGPFAFADDARVRSILEAAGFRDIEIRAADAPMRLGASVAEAVEMSMEVGPLARVLDGMDDAARTQAREAVTRSLQARTTPEGVALTGAVWVVTATAP